MKKIPSCLSALVVLASPGLSFALEHGNLDVVQLNTTNNGQASPEPAVAVTIKPGATPNFAVRGHNRGDFDMAFSATPAQDCNNGVMITSVTQNGRNNVSGGGPDGITYSTSMAELSANGFFIPVHAASGGAESVDGNPPTLQLNGGGEFNVNLAAAWFPYAEGWLGAHASAGSVNGGPLTADFRSNPLIRLGAGLEFVDNSTSTPAVNGTALVNLTALQSHGVPATSSNGVVLVVGGKNEDNYALSRDNADGTFSLTVKDNGQNGVGSEQDGVAFVYVPTAAAGRGHVKAVGRIQSDGSSEVGGGNFTITKQGVGQWLLTIPDQTDATGTLIISAEGGRPAAGTTPNPNNVDNIVSYEWNQALGGWLIESRDLPTIVPVASTTPTLQPALEDGLTADEDMFSFAFLTTAPAIALTSPVKDAIYPTDPGSQLTLSATNTVATPAEIQQIEFFIDGVSVGTDATAPFEISVPSPLPGQRKVEAVATLNGGAVVSSVLTPILMEAKINPPTISGYSLGIIDGGDPELDPDKTSNPAPAWATVLGTPSPLGFTALGNVSGEPAVKINDNAVPFNSGILLGLDYAGENWLDITTRGSIDNLLIPRNEGGNYALSVKDLAQDASTDPVNRPESGRFTMGFFPYANGWVGAHVNENGTINTDSANLPAGITVTNNAAGTYTISGLPQTGNMLALSTGTTAGADNVSNIGQVGVNWSVINRDNSQNVENGDFAFLYIPQEATGVYSGKIANDGTLTPLNVSMAAVGATVDEVAGTYEIIFGDGTIINPSNTALFVTADYQNGNGGDNVYSYHADGNKFVVFSHDLPGVPGTPQAGGFRFLAAPYAPVAAAGDEVFVKVTDNFAQENTADTTLQFVFTRTGDTTPALTVNYGIGGTATNGADYETLPGAVTFAAGSATATVNVTINTESLYEEDETLIISLLPGTGYTATAFQASATIRNASSLVPVATASFQNGVDNYTGTFSKHIGKNALPDASGNPVYTNTLGSSAASYYLDGYPGHADSADQNAIMRFDNIFGNGPGQIPAGAKVTKAELILTTANGANSRSPGPFVVDRLIVPVTAETTYADLDAGYGFEGVRGSSSGLPVAAFGSMTNQTAQVADVTAIVRYWANELIANPNENPNLGFSIYTGGTADGWEYCAEGNTTVALRPKLVVSYVTSPISIHTYSADRSALLNGAGPTVDGSTLSLAFVDLIADATTEGFMRFPVTFGTAETDIPEDEEIVRAELVLTTGTPLLLEGSTNAHSPGPISVHQVLTDWTVETAFGPAGPVAGTNIGPEVSRVTGMGQTSAAYLDVTAIVQAWRRGAPNYGVNVKPQTTDGWQIFWPGASEPYPGAEPTLRIVTAETTAPSAFQIWAESKGAAGILPTSDNDRDGLTAVVEYALGFDPRKADASPVPIKNGNNVTLQFVKGSAAKSDTAVKYEIAASEDLIEWAPLAEAVDGPDDISVTLPANATKKFFKLVVTYTP
ncbi:Calx-beta domain-containing protein [Luteolibacter luteus]|uniref:Calx-beta domain-containing protein n=1 Tax=Luteolibacter luteus TaxID=2728835 RepID=A0A858RNI8_9BACT|nr:Calx-beta domain-containing protein [Luteolibacter luteus]QJE98432.1 hypothetical protein HHL09_22470 [Luteolibacter luteus]